MNEFWYFISFSKLVHCNCYHTDDYRADNNILILSHEFQRNQYDDVNITIILWLIIVSPPTSLFLFSLFGYSFLDFYLQITTFCLTFFLFIFVVINSFHYFEVFDRLLSIFILLYIILTYLFCIQQFLKVDNTLICKDHCAVDTTQ